MKIKPQYVNYLLLSIIEILLALGICLWIPKAFELTKDYKGVNLQTAQTATKLLYSYTTMEHISSNAETLSELCSPEIFPLMDNRTPSVLTTRFVKYTPTQPYIREVFSPNSKGDIVYVVVEFEPQTLLNAKLLKFTFEDNIINDYQEYYIGTEVYPLDSSKRSLDSFLDGND